MASGQRVLVGVIVAVVVVVVGAGIVLLGPPSEERARRLDRRRVEDLGEVSRSVEAYEKRHERLPSSIQELSAEPGVRIEVDPVTEAPYDYRALDGNRYELCASFARSSQDKELQPWSHDAGRQCFERTVKEIR